MTKKRASIGISIWISLLCLFNPNFNLLDVFPDCIAYLLIILVIGKASDTVPYLEECKSALGRLALVSGIKIPTFFFMYKNLANGRDIVPMFTLIFVTLESILLYSAIKNGYKALSYLGERTDAAVALDPFPLNKKGKTMTPFSLMVMTMVFFFAKGVLTLIPDLFMLTQKNIEDKILFADAYPVAVAVCMLAVTLAGAVWMHYAKKYVRALKSTDEISEAIKMLNVNKNPEENKSESKTKSIIGALTILAFSSLLTFDVILSNIGETNLLPHFIYGLVIFYVMFNLAKAKKHKIVLASVCGAYAVFSFVAHMMLERFFNKGFNYIYLIFSSPAKEAYLPVQIFSVIEVICAVAMMYVCAKVFIEFLKDTCSTSAEGEIESTVDKKCRKSLTVKTVVLFAWCGVISVLKCVNVFLKGNAKIAFSQTNEEGFATGTLPWMGTLIFFVCLVFVIYSFYFVSEVKNEVRFKQPK